MGRNYGLGTRDLAQAGRKALARKIGEGELSYASVDAIADRWAHFARYAKLNGVGKMERITLELALEYGAELADMVRAGELTAAYAQNLVSSVNTVMGLVRTWKSLSPTKDCQIEQRCFVRQDPPASTDPRAFQRAIESLRQRGLVRQAVIAQLARHFGLRSKEASLFSAKVALRQAMAEQVVRVSEGTKGGRARAVPVTGQIQLAVLDEAAILQAEDRSLVPSQQTWIQWRNGGLRDGREVLKKLGFSGYHDLRAGYACERYYSATGYWPPVCGGRILDRTIDYDARLVISQELGHNRVDVVSAYVGGR